MTAVIDPHNGDAFLKWVGSKRKLIKRLRDILPPGSRLIEPFLGGGSVFMGTNYPTYLLADSSPHLMGVYQSLSEHGTKFIDSCASYFTDRCNQEAVYYALRQVFNETTDPYLRSVLFVYLNRHCFNGLYRVNRDGEFNVSYGFYKRPYFPRLEMVGFHSTLRMKQAVLRCQDFVTTMAEAQPGDVVYCDPPYVPVRVLEPGGSVTGIPTEGKESYVGYTRDKFGESDQIVLADIARSLSLRGITVIVSNRDNDCTRHLYTGAQLFEASVKHTVAANGCRDPVNELIAVFGSAMPMLVEHPVTLSFPELRSLAMPHP